MPNFSLKKNQGRSIFKKSIFNDQGRKQLSNYDTMDTKQ